MSAVTERARRSTAGRRMTSLVGKAQEEDDTFWTHDTWADDDEDSGNDSFRESDEDEDQRVDTFDSDFNDSETDNEDEEMAEGALEEEELQRQEKSKRTKKGGGNYVDIVKAGRDLMQRKKGTTKGKQRKKDLMGDGMNAGLVLNIPGQQLGGQQFGGGQQLSQPQHHQQPLLPVAAVATAGSGQQPQQHQRQRIASRQTTTKIKAVTLASTRSRRGGTTATTTTTGGRRKVRTATHQQTIDTVTAANDKQQQQSSQQPHKKKQNRATFTQEQLLLEAATITEPENERWLLGRKRTQDMENSAMDKLRTSSSDKAGKRITSMFHSRRGCFNTLTFPEMDAVPAIFATKHVAPPKPSKQLCVITGKPARYRDRRTNQLYYDLQAFRELRRRHAAGEPFEQQTPKPIVKQEKAPTTHKSPILSAPLSGIVATSATITTNGYKEPRPTKTAPISVKTESATVSNKKNGPPVAMEVVSASNVTTKPPFTAKTTNGNPLKTIPLPGKSEPISTAALASTSKSVPLPLLIPITAADKTPAIPTTSKALPTTSAATVTDPPAIMTSSKTTTTTSKTSSTATKVPSPEAKISTLTKVATTKRTITATNGGPKILPPQNTIKDATAKIKSESNNLTTSMIEEAICKAQQQEADRVRAGDIAAASPPHVPMTQTPSTMAGSVANSIDSSSKKSVQSSIEQNKISTTNTSTKSKDGKIGSSSSNNEVEQANPKRKATASITTTASASPTKKKPRAVRKKTVSPTTTNMINNALEAYTKLHPTK